MYGEENSVVILTFVSTEDLGFMEEPQRLCVALSRGRDALIIFHNVTSNYQVQTSRIFMDDEEDIILAREKAEYLSNKRYFDGLKALIGPVEEDTKSASHKGKGKEKMSSPTQATEVLSTPATVTAPTVSSWNSWAGDVDLAVVSTNPVMQDLGDYDTTPEVDDQGQPVADHQLQLLWSRVAFAPNLLRIKSVMTRLGRKLKRWIPRVRCGKEMAMSTLFFLRTPSLAIIYITYEEIGLSFLLRR
ncbi:hypothetical protein MMC17_005872 [Xylographa soralifera]|nr:hypothetical protein [Xylographa soralifera]